jgi:hypothetical protein
MYLAHNAIIPEFENENGVYIVKTVSKEWAQMEKVTGILPANTGVVVKGEGEYEFVYTQESATANVEGNFLRGTAEDTYIAGDAYVLANSANGIGLYGAILNKDAEGNDGTTHFKNNANKAYLPARLVSDASLYANLRFDFDGNTTGVEEVEIRNEKEEIYDLTGRRVNAIERGLYIAGGKKILVK